MKKQIFWSAAIAALMLGCPWLAVRYAGDAGMAVCFLLFYAADPLFCALAGVFAGRALKELWFLPLLAPGAFLAGVWLLFEMGEPAFLLYAGIYLAIGTVAALISAIIFRHRG